MTAEAVQSTMSRGATSGSCAEGQRMPPCRNLTSAARVAWHGIDHADLPPHR